MRKVRINVFGRVQGVNFRRNVKGFCDNNGVKGFVKNMGDGSVLIRAWASPEKIDSLVGFIRGSPGISKVEDVKISNEDSEESYNLFEIIREGSIFKDQKKALANLGRKLLKD